MKKLVFVLAASLVLFSCDKEESLISSDASSENYLELKSSKSKLDLSFSGLSPLGPDYRYEGWIIVDGMPVSTGKFNITPSGNMSPSVFNVSMADLDAATTFVLTIEPQPDHDPAPSAVHVLGGDFAEGSASLSIAHPAALNTDFASAAGNFILATPTTATMDDELSGIWFLNVPGPVAGLTLPALPTGWVYEGWAVIDGVPVSSGKFDDVADYDWDDSYSGAGSGPPFPGEDYVMNAPAGLMFPTDLSGGKAVISALNGEDLKQEKTNRRALFTRMKESGDTLTSDPELIYFDVLNKDLWFWVIPFSTNETSIGFVGDSSFFTSPDEKRNLTINEMLELSPFFKERFKKAEPLLDDIESVEYTNSTENIFGKNYVLIGNSMGFQDPVFSSGVAIATSSAIKASSLVDRELKGEKVDWSEDYQEWIDQGSKVFKTYIDYWYDGTLQAIFFCDNIQEITKRQITSVLAGYVWDQSNPFVKNPERLLKTLQKVIDIEFRKNDLKGQ